MQGHAPIDSSDSNEGVGKLIKKIEKIPKNITIPIFRKAAQLDALLGKMNNKSKMTMDDRKLYRQIGTVAAKIHKQSKAWREPSYYKRLVWDFEGTFGVEWNNFYGESYRSKEWLSEKDIAILDECVLIMQQRLKLYGKSKERYGMIHSDLRAANLLKEGDKIGVLDFDDCGKGWYMYEIAGIVALIEHRSDLNEIIQEVLQGYEEVLPIMQEDKDEVKTFIMMRRIGMLQGLISRIGCVVPGEGESVELTPEILAFYAKGTVVLAKGYIKQCAAQQQVRMEKHYIHA
jgi:thiamine kinase-like enzyme